MYISPAYSERGHFRVTLIDRVEDVNFALRVRNFVRIERICLGCLLFELRRFEGYIATSEPFLVLLVSSHGPIPEPGHSVVSTIVAVMPIVTFRTKHDRGKEAPRREGEVVARVGI